jgi:DNA-binding phage protein
MERFLMFSQNPLVDSRKAAFARLASRVLETLNDAVSTRKDEGQTLSAIAEKIGCNRSSLTRTLNGSSANMTLRTISDILWATNFDPQDFSADPIEKISPNWLTDSHEIDQDVEFRVYLTQDIKMDSAVTDSLFSATTVGSPKLEFSQL